MRCADTGSQHGAAVILALLSVALAAGLTAALLGDFGRSLDSVAGRQDQAQARLLARGAVDWARNVLADDFKRTNVDHAHEMWAVRVPPTPVGDGEVGGEIHDRSGLFNLNNLMPDGKADPVALAQFGRLLATLGVAPADAGRLAHAVVDWIGGSTTNEEKNGIASSGLRASGGNGSLLDAAELRLVAGFDEALVDRLTPFVTALPAPTRINVNTAPAEVLAAVVADLELNDARILVAERERAWFRDLADFSARLPAGAQAPGTGLDVRSRHFAVIGRSGFGSAVVRMEVLLDRRETWPTILWQRIL
ncbi:type II secretion system minor pseudopilin GspK [Aromatoleum buckelii]|uniref:Type II secretion system protein K n=1 Tax=Aromatoleum buckelii TaxID=200254 RepID=A0ABX1MXL9_9RHOO|nr:type II secretion system minor pseudopilin GspK [Aromatoleum buckelii]MCK0511163.1 type II secretion system minor pseudopilin GspK [Aromatoleum buckelii]